MTGLVHRMEIKEGGVKEEEIGELYEKGDYVKVHVLKKKEDKKQLSVSFKAKLVFILFILFSLSYFFFSQVLQGPKRGRG